MHLRSSNCGHDFRDIKITIFKCLFQSPVDEKKKKSKDKEKVCWICLMFDWTTYLIEQAARGR